MTRRIAEPAENPSTPVSETAEPQLDVPATVAMIEGENPELAEAVREANPVKQKPCSVCSLVTGKPTPHDKSRLHAETHN